MWRIRIAAERWTRDQTLAAQGAASVLVNSLSFVPHLSNWKRDLTSAVGREYNQEVVRALFSFHHYFRIAVRHYPLAANIFYCACPSFL
jgi:hypothetical protein